MTSYFRIKSNVYVMAYKASMVWGWLHLFYHFSLFYTLSAALYSMVFPGHIKHVAAVVLSPSFASHLSSYVSSLEDTSPTAVSKLSNIGAVFFCTSSSILALVAIISHINLFSSFFLKCKLQDEVRGFIYLFIFTALSSAL